MPVDYDKLRAQIKLHEGYRNGKYLDTKQIPTIGVGFNLHRSDAREKIEALGYDYTDVLHGRQKISDEHVNALLEPTLEEAEEIARKLVYDFDDLCEVRQRVVTDMAFNMGYPTFKQFKNTLFFINHGQFDKAARNMLKSLWAKQVGPRAKNLAKMMQTGQDVYNL